MSSLTVYETYMRRCLELADTARARGDVPVGALVTRNGQVLGEGFEGVRALVDPTAHAELEAVRAACRKLVARDLSGATLYTTAEPCFMRSYAIRQTRIALVVMGTPVPSVGGVTSVHPILVDPAIADWAAPPRVLRGMLQAQCEALRHNDL